MTEVRTKRAQTVKGGARTSAPRAKAVVFRFPAPRARRVTLAGEFNGWDAQALPMEQETDGTWSATVKLRPGTYEYKLVVDGEWCEDHTNPRRSQTSEGVVNSVVEVR